MLKASCCILLLLAVAGCGGKGSSGNPTPTPTPSAGLSVCANTGSGCANPAVVSFAGTAQFQATSNGASPAVNWAVNGVQGGSSSTGTISASGLFTAPGNFDSGKTVTITATEQSNASISGTGSAVIVNNSSGQSAPIKMGTSGGNVNDLVNNGKTITCCSGTLGALLQTNAASFFILSNNHVLDKSDTGTKGDVIGQPGLIDNNCAAGPTVATLTASAPLKPTSCTTTPCTGPSPSNVDAAIAAISGGMVDTSGSILDLGAVNGAGINPAPPSATIESPATVLSSGDGLAKVGRSTGLTCSTLESISASFNVSYSSSCGGATAFTATYTNQVAVNGGNFSAAGDSGSLIVTSNNARPVALLFAGSNTDTVGSPIQAILTRAEFQVGGTPTMVGGADHAVSCSAVASSGILTTTSASFTGLSAQEQARVSAVRGRNAATLMKNESAISSVQLGVSRDSRGEGALVIHVSGPTAAPIPAVVEGVRTAVISDQQTGRLPALSLDDIDNTRVIKEAHESNIMSQSGIQGIGVGRSDDNPAETAIVIYVIQGVAHPPITATIDGVRTKIIEGDRFRAFDWGKEKKTATKCARK